MTLDWKKKKKTNEKEEIDEEKVSAGEFVLIIKCLVFLTYFIFLYMFLRDLLEDL